MSPATELKLKNDVLNLQPSHTHSGGSGERADTGRLGRDPEGPRGHDRGDARTLGFLKGPGEGGGNPRGGGRLGFHGAGLRLDLLHGLFTRQRVPGFHRLPRRAGGGGGGGDGDGGGGALLCSDSGRALRDGGAGSEDGAATGGGRGAVGSVQGLRYGRLLGSGGGVRSVNGVAPLGEGAGPRRDDGCLKRVVVGVQVRQGREPTFTFPAGCRAQGMA